MEVLVAIAILGFMLVPLFNLLGSVLNGSTRYARQLERLKQAQLFLYDCVIAREKDSASKRILEKKATNPTTILKYELAELPSTSPVLKKKDVFRDIYKEKIEMRWEDGRQSRTDALILFIFKPEKKT